MSIVPNWKLYKECPCCKTWNFGQYDAYCSHCGKRLGDHERLAGIADYAKTLLVDLLENYPDIRDTYIGDIPDYATAEIRANGNIMFNQTATRRVLAECWNEVETALDDWRETNGLAYPVKNIEDLHVFSVSQHAEMVWREITGDFESESLTDEDIEEAIERLKRR
jgi:hypothetical protein